MRSHCICYSVQCSYSVAYKAAKNIPNPFFFTLIFMDGNRYGEFVDSVGELPALYVAVSLNF